MSRPAVLYGCDELVGAWIKKRIPDDGGRFENFKAMGVVVGDRLVAGVLWNMYYGHMISVTFVADSPRWASRRILAELFEYPFCQLDVARITAYTGRKNKSARKLLEHLGFKVEGVMRKGRSRKEDAILYGMLKAECRWLRDARHDEHAGSAGGDGLAGRDAGQPGAAAL